MYLIANPKFHLLSLIDDGASALAAEGPSGAGYSNNGERNSLTAIGISFGLVYGNFIQSSDFQRVLNKPLR